MVEFDERREIALRHAWNWFELHANHRLTLVRYYLLIVGAGLAAFAAAVFNQQIVLSLVASLLVGGTTFLFEKLEQRIRYLVKTSESAMDRLESDLAVSTSVDEIRLVRNADEKEKGSWSYRVAFIWMFRLMYLLAALGLVASLYLIFYTPQTAF